MKNKNIVLIGFMGAGKSLASKNLAEYTGRQVYSTDALIEESQGRSIPEIFKDKGEAFFRALEEKTVSELAGLENAVVDCGGGVVLNPKNSENLKKNGIFFYLEASPEMILKNIRTKGQAKRPLLEGADPLVKITELLDQRKSFYESAADYTINTNGKTVEQFCLQIRKILKEQAS